MRPNNRPIGNTEDWTHQRKIEIGEAKSNFLLSTHYTVKRRILKSSLMRQIAPLEYINTLLKRSLSKQPS
jgi:hypothetical protein